MKYLKEVELKDRKGNSIEISVPKTGQELEKQDLTSGLFAYLTMDAYMPVQGLTLRQAEMRYYDKVLNKLDGESENGYWVFEDGEFGVLKQCIDHIAPLVPLLFKYQVAMDDVMKAVLDQLPEEK